MKKLITGVAIAASLVTGAFANDHEDQVKANFISGLQEQETLLEKVAEYEHVYIQTLGGRNNGINDASIRVGKRGADFDLGGVTDYSFAYSKEGQFDLNAKFFKAVNSERAIYLGTGFERFNSENAANKSSEMKDNFYLEAGLLSNMTSNSVLVFGGKFGAEKSTAKLEIQYSISKNIRAIALTEYSFMTENDNQKNVMAGLEFSF